MIIEKFKLIRFHNIIIARLTKAAYILFCLNMVPHMPLLSRMKCRDCAY